MHLLNLFISSTTEIYRTMKNNNTWFKADYTNAEGNKIKKRSNKEIYKESGEQHATR